MLRHYALHFPPNFGSIVSVSMGISMPRFASISERRNENIQYFISSSGNRTHNLSRLQSHACAYAPQLTKYKNYKEIITISIIRLFIKNTVV